MKNLLLSYALLLALALPFRSLAAGPPDIIVVRIAEYGGKAVGIITRGEGKNEKVEFEMGGTDKRLIQSSEAYYKLMQRLYQEGYALQSTFSTAAPNIGGGGGYVTLLFVKQP